MKCHKFHFVDRDLLIKLCRP